MQPQSPAEGILLTHDFGNAKYYSVQCSCGNPDDIVSLAVELTEFGEVEVTHSTIEHTDWWGAINTSVGYAILHSIWHRLKVTFEVWTTGTVHYRGSILMSKQQALNYSTTLADAVHSVTSLPTKE